MPERHASDKGGLDELETAGKAVSKLASGFRLVPSQPAQSARFNKAKAAPRPALHPDQTERGSAALDALDVPVDHREVLVGHPLALGRALLAGLV